MNWGPGGEKKRAQINGMDNVGYRLGLHSATTRRWGLGDGGHGFR